jgi:LuxR family maltose regulon positive regulatory protein
VLEHLEATNLFVVPLDEQRAWYRYHRLFADLLRARLGELYPDRVAQLHSRASAWYERQGLVDEAMSHALAASDSARATEIVARHGRTLLLRGELTTLLRWIEALPEEDVRGCAPICVTHAWALLLTGRLAAVEPRVEQVEHLVPADSPLLGDVAAIRAYVASQRGDLPRTIKLAERALERLPEAKLGERAVVFFVLGGAQLWRGEVPAAADAFGRAATVGQEGGNLHLALPALNSLATIQASQGKLRQAKATAEEAVALVTGPDGEPRPIGAGALSALAELACERDRLDEALRYARQGVELARLWGNADTLGFGYLTLADVLLALGRLDEARDALRDAERMSQDLTLFPSFPSALGAARARLWLREGDLAAAGRWAEGVTIPKLDVTAMERALTQAQVEWARRRLDDALGVLGRLLEAAREQGLKGWLIKGLALEAVIHQAQGRETPALAALAEALELVRLEGYVRTFVDLGPPMAALLQRAAAQDVASEYVGCLLAAFDRAVEAEMPRSPQVEVLIEPLSPRELEVLGLVAEGLSNREVGQRLHIAESTVKSHLNNVYGKLGVDNRTQAAAKARSLNLL